MGSATQHLPQLDATLLRSSSESSPPHPRRRRSSGRAVHRRPWTTIGKPCHTLKPTPPLAPLRPPALLLFRHLVVALAGSGRLNSPSTSAISLELLGHRLHISQDPNSKHLGTTVWDASMVFAKFLEKNSRKGRFCPSKLKGKRVIELGAGCGLAGLGMALLGCDVVTTDQVEVLPLLMRNVERNKSWISQSNSDSGSFGSVTVAELDWGNKEHIRAVDPPFDYIIGTDVVYSEHLLQPLMETIIALSGPKTKVILGYEIRSTIVHEQMMEMWKNNFIVKTISKSKMDAKYQHPSIHLYMMDPKAPALGSSENGNTEEEGDDASNPEGDEDPGVNTGSCTGLVDAKPENSDDWETRRCGAMAARLLKDVKLT